MFVQYSCRLARPQHTKEKQPKDELLERLEGGIKIPVQDQCGAKHRFAELLQLSLIDRKGPSKPPKSWRAHRIGQEIPQGR